MAAYSPPGEKHTAFIQWALAQGVKVNGVEPARIPGRGLGMVATRDIQENEIMVEAPLSTMVSVDSIPNSFTNSFVNGISIHGLLAAFFTHGDPEILKKYDLWKATWPDITDFEEGMPILWPERLGGLNLKNSHETTNTTHNPSNSGSLPPSISASWSTFRKKSVTQDYDIKDHDIKLHQNLLRGQNKRLQDAWRDVIAVFPDTNWDTFLYYWLVVNTRCFYYVMPGEEPPEDTNDAMALVPFADYFNHVDNAECDVNFDGQSYTFRATRKYEKGEEVYMSYGPHTNDLLFIEYGFYLENNGSDALFLDDIIFKDLKAEEREELVHQRYYGNYQITLESGPCFRTEVAASLKCMPRRSWKNYVQGRGAAPNSTKMNAIIRGWVETYLKEAEFATSKLRDMLSEGKDGSKVKMSIGRWEQVQQLCEGVLSKLNS